MAAHRMITGLDHLVLTVRSLEASAEFYRRVLGGERRDEPGRPTAIVFGRQKLNLHAADHTFEPKAAHPTPGAGDLCLLTDLPPEAVSDKLADAGVPVELGPVQRTGARGPMVSIYCRDPDGNLIEIASYGASGAAPDPPAR